MIVTVNELGDFIFYTSTALTGNALDTCGLHYTNALSDTGRLATNTTVLNIIVHNSSNVSNVRLRSEIERYEG